MEHLGYTYILGLWVDLPIVYNLCLLPQKTTKSLEDPSIRPWGTVVVDTPLFLVLFVPLVGGKDGNSHHQISSFLSRKPTKTVQILTVFNRKNTSTPQVECWIFSCEMAHSFWFTTVGSRNSRLFYCFLNGVYRLWDIVGYFGYMWSCYIPNTMKDEMYVIWRKIKI